MDWYTGSIPDAVAEVKSHKKVLLVFVVGEDELSKRMAITYDDPAVSNKLNLKECVALKLTVNSVPYRQFSQIYPVVVIPSSYFIGKNGLPIEIITGSLEPSEFMEKIDKIFQLNEDGDSSANTSELTQSNELPQAVEPMESSESDISGAVQNGCERSNQPSTSQSELASGGAINPENSEEIAQDADSNVSLEDRVNRAKTLLENRRQNKAMEEQEKEKREEQERRKTGKAVQQAQQSRHDTELKAWAESRAKEKEEERVARERVRAQIAQDRAERAAKYQQTKVDEVAVQKEKEMRRIKEVQEKATRDASLRSTIARLQFRLPDGTSVTHQFAANSTLGEARNFVIEEIRPSFSSFTLCTTFPRRHFAEEDYLQTLKDLQLAPSAALLVLPPSCTERRSTEVLSGGQCVPDQQPSHR